MKKFWSIAVVDPSTQCRSLTDAEQEAARLAELNPGKDIFVLEAKASCRCGDVAWKTFIEDHVEEPWPHCAAVPLPSTN